MCYAIPGKVKEINNKTILVDYFGEEKRAINDFYDLNVGDYISAQGGYVIKKIPPAEAQDILSTWHELFFELQDIDLRLSRVDFQNNDIDKKLSRILDKALENIPLKQEELLSLINLNNPTALDLFFKTANFIRQKYHKNSCCVHGIIEISNYCKRHCTYCGISAHNNNITRYRMTPDEILEAAVQAVQIYGFQALVLQSGEDPHYSINELTDIIKRIKERVPVLICISFGEVGLEGLENLFEAGARGLLMRFETSNPNLFEKLHPSQTLETRLNHIRRAYELGYLIITGGLIGLPGQTHEDIINDIQLTKKLHAEMYSFGPYLPHPDTPLQRSRGLQPALYQKEDVLKTLALARLIDPENAKILVTTAFETLDSSARKEGLLAGANSVMLNVTPIKYRKLYSIYPDKAHSTELINAQIEETISLLKSLGRAPTDLGISKNNVAALDETERQRDVAAGFSLRSWITTRIKKDQITKYMDGGKDFINDKKIIEKLHSNKEPDQKHIKDILQKSLSVQTLTLDETAALLNVTDKDLLEEMRQTAVKVKTKVYDNRIVTFAPLYMGNHCVNNCLYCGFRKDNNEVKRKSLSLDEVKKETEVLAGKIGHKRIIAVYGEHPSTDIDYIVDTIKAIYSIQSPLGEIRRVNVNAAPFSIEDLKKLHEVGIGTYQVFQETYHHKTYEKIHPKNTLKRDYRWRLYCMHRAFEAGIDDVGIGALFGLYDWKFEVMGLIAHNIELEEKFGVGAHTISFPRLEPAVNTPFIEESKYKVLDEEFKKIITTIRLSVPHTGMIITAREKPQIRRDALSLGVTQTDASTRIGIGAYSDRYTEQEKDRQQFLLGDTRSLDDVIRELAQMGYITSFCTAGYRCGRTGGCIMDLLRKGQERWFCKLNAVLTFKEYLMDFASPQTKKAGEEIIKKEIKEIETNIPDALTKFREYFHRIENGERDLYF